MERNLHSESGQENLSVFVYWVCGVGDRRSIRSQLAKLRHFGSLPGRSNEQCLQTQNTHCATLWARVPPKTKKNTITSGKYLMESRTNKQNIMYLAQHCIYCDPIADITFDKPSWVKRVHPLDQGFWLSKVNVLTKTSKPERLTSIGWNTVWIFADCGDFSLEQGFRMLFTSKQEKNLHGSMAQACPASAQVLELISFDWYVENLWSIDFLRIFMPERWAFLRALSKILEYEPAKNHC